MKETEPNPRLLRLFFFLTGIIATLAYRLIIVLNFYSALLVKIAWYTGTIGFIIYFWHRWMVQDKRGDLVRDYELVDLVKNMKTESEDQKEALEYIVETSLTSRSKWNSIFIFGMSVLALLVGAAIDLYVVFF